MIERTIARRYAKALLEVAVGRRRVRETESELTAVAELFRAAPEFRTALTSPVIPRRRRRAAAGRALAGRVGDDVIAFLQILIEEGRAGLLPQIAELYDDLADAQEGIVEVAVRSARPLPDAQVERLRAALERVTRGRRIELELSVDPDLLGGLVLSSGDRVLDGSVAGWLKRTRERLMRQTE
jgi:F-type H+-transporting ATPase subunit delta